MEECEASMGSAVNGSKKDLLKKWRASTNTVSSVILVCVEWTGRKQSLAQTPQQCMCVPAKSTINDDSDRYSTNATKQK